LQHPPHPRCTSTDQQTPKHQHQQYKHSLNSPSLIVMRLTSTDQRDRRRNGRLAMMRYSSCSRSATRSWVSLTRCRVHTLLFWSLTVAICRLASARVSIRLTVLSYRNRNATSIRRR
jgi:hypothetical protein